MPEIVPEKSHAADAAKIQDELVLFVKYIDSSGEIRTSTKVEADAKINASTMIDLETTLDSLSSYDISATNRVAAICNPNEATDEPTIVTRTTAEYKP